MDNKKYKVTMGAIAGLAVLSSGMFLYENVYVVNQEQDNKVGVYIANTTIEPHSLMTSDMLTEVKLDKTSILKGYITDPSNIVGKYAVGGILKGEPVMSQRLSQEALEATEELNLKLVPDYSGDLAVHDNVRILVQLTDRNTGETSVKELFNTKKIRQMAEGKDKALGFYITATEKEVQDYYVAKERGRVIAVKINALDLGTDTTEQESEADAETDVPTFDADSDAVTNATNDKTTADEGVAIKTYTIQEDDTFESLALRFKTKAETIQTLNNDMRELEPGKTIQVPAN